MRVSLLKLGQAVALIGTLGLAPAAMAQNAAFTDQQKQAIGEIVKDYLLKNPEVLTEVIGELEKRQAEAQQVAQAGAVKETKQSLLNASHSYVVGNPSGDVTLVEFFDYNCGYCKKALADVQHPDEERLQAARRAEGLPRPGTRFRRGEPCRTRGQEPAPGLKTVRLPREGHGQPRPRQRRARHGGRQGHGPRHGPPAEGHGERRDPRRPSGESWRSATS